MSDVAHFHFDLQRAYQDMFTRMAWDSMTEEQKRNRSAQRPYNPFTDENTKNMLFVRLKTAVRAYPETQIKQGDCITTLADLYDLHPELEGAVCTVINRRLIVAPMDGYHFELCEILAEETEQ